MNEDCIFCKIAKGEIPSEKIYENKNFFSIRDISQKVDGHCLIISKKHFENLLEMPNTLGQELLDAIKSTAIKIVNKVKAEGFNVVQNNGKSAGQIVKHVHFHILPRKKDDKFRF